MFVNPCNYTLDDDDLQDISSGPGGEKSAFDPDFIEEENAAGDKGDNVFGTTTREELHNMIKDGSHSVDTASIKAELVIGFRDKKQHKKEQKMKND